MPYDVKYLEENGIVVIENKGELKYDELVRQTQEAIKLGQGKNSKLFLTNFSNVEVRAQTMELFNFPVIYEQFGMNRMSRIAVVVSEMELKTEELHFYETICLNRGWNIKIFLHKDLALDWLKKNMNK